MSKVKLSVYRNENLVNSYEFEVIDNVENEVFIGRSEDCHLTIDDHQISRDHISLIYSNGIMSLKNLSKYHNIYVNGKNVTNALVSDSDSVQFYDYNLVIEGVQEEAGDSLTTPVDELKDTVSEASEGSIEESEVEKKPDTDFVSDNKTKTELSLDIKEDDKTAMVEPVGDTFIRESSPSYTNYSDQEMKTITEKVQSIIGDEAIDEEVQADQGDSSFGDFEESSTPEASEVLEFTEEVSTDGFSNSNMDEDENTGIIDNFAQLFLEITGEDVPYNKFLLDRAETVIGTSRKDCSIVLEDKDVSPKHARVIYQKKRVYVEDLDSKFGTYVNGEKVNKSELKDGDEFLIGSISFVLRVGSEVLSEEVKRLMPVEAEQEVIEHKPFSEDFLEEKNSGNHSQVGGIRSLKMRFENYLANPEKKRIFYILMIGLIVFILLDDEPSTSSKIVKKSNSTKDSKQDSKKDLNLPSTLKKRSKEEMEYLEAHYLLAKNKIEEGEYDDALFEVDLVRSVDPNYKQIDLIYGMAKEGLAKIEEAERKRKEEEERQKIETQIKDLLAKAKDAMDEDKLKLAETYLSQIAEFDPENKNLYSLKIEIDAARDQQKKLQEEKEEREERRRAFLSRLAPAKRLYSEGKWYKSMKTIEEALKEKKVDKDLLDEANDLFSKAQNKLNENTASLLSDARSYKEGKDFKNAYETYKKVLDINPVNTEAIVEVNEIQSSLDTRAKKIFREAIISESISLHDDAKEKFLEVLQIAPIDSEYYRKAKAKLDEFYVE